MENTTTNLTVDQYSQVRSPGVVVSFMIIVLLLIAISVFDLFVMIALGMETKVARPICIFLINLLIANTLIALTQIIFFVSTSSYILFDINNPSLGFCRVMIWFWGAVSPVRSFSLTTFSLAVALMGRYGITFFKPRYIVTALCVIWVTAIVMDVYVLVPQLLSVTYLEGVVCYPDTRGTGNLRNLSRVLNGIWWIVAGAIPIIATTVLSLTSICYFKYCKQEEGAERQGRLGKFAFFLLFGNMANFICILLPVILSMYDATIVGACISSALITLTLIPTPILVVVFLKPVRVKMKKMITSCRCQCECTNRQPTRESPISCATTIATSPV